MKQNQSKILKFTMIQSTHYVPEAAIPTIQEVPHPLCCTHSNAAFITLVFSVDEINEGAKAF